MSWFQYSTNNYKTRSYHRGRKYSEFILRKREARQMNWREKILFNLLDPVSILTWSEIDHVKTGCMFSLRDTYSRKAFPWETRAVQCFDEESNTWINDIAFLCFIFVRFVGSSCAWLVSWGHQIKEFRYYWQKANAI